MIFSPVKKRKNWIPLVYLLVAGAILLASIKPIGSYDLWWQLASGRWILEEGAVPTEDPFSFTRSGTFWVDHGWLFQILAFLAFGWGGWQILLVFVLGFVLTSYAILGWRLRREGLSPALMGILLLFSLTGAQFRFDPRPELISFCFTAVLAGILLWTREPARGGWIFSLFPLFLIWANVHPGVTLGAGVLYLWLGTEWILARMAGKTLAGGPHRLWVGLVAPFLAILNPGGWHLLALPWRLREIITSGHAPNLEWASPTIADFPLFYLTLVGAAGILWVGWRSLDLPVVLATAAVAVLSLAHLRNLGFFFLLLPLALAKPLARILATHGQESPRRRWGEMAVLLIISFLFVQGNVQARSTGYVEKIAWEKPVAFIEQHGLGRRLFNDVKFGGFLIWSRYPEQQVFIDGRNEVYDSLLAEVFSGLASWEEWEALLTRYEIDSALLRRGQMKKVRYPSERPGEPPEEGLRAFSAAYFQSSRWALVYWDDQALLFVRRADPKAAPLLDKEYRYVNPDDTAYLMKRISRGEVEMGPVLEELDRRLSEDPDCRTAARLKLQVSAQP